MGRLAVLQGSRQATAGGTPYYVGGPFSMAGDVTWKCTTISGYRSPLQPVTTNINPSSFEASLVVDGADVFALRWYSQNGLAAREANVFVLPWFDGLRFNAGQTVGWNLTADLQGYVSCSFIGERD
jgi:hypothetical protein